MRINGSLSCGSCANPKPKFIFEGNKKLNYALYLFYFKMEDYFFFYGNNITMKTDLQKPIESITVNGIQHKFPQFIFILCNLISILRYIKYKIHKI